MALALAIGTCGLAFTGIAAVAAQLASGARAARGLAFGVLGVAFLARAVGDSAGAGGPSWLTWVLPLGWTETMRPFAGERWWVLALPLALFAAGVGLAFALAAAARLRSGPAARPARQAVRVGRAARPVLAGLAAAVGALAGWAAGYAVMFAVCGAAGKGIGQLVGSSGALEKEFTRLGGQAAIVNAYLAALMLLGGLGRGRLRGVRRAAAARRGDRGPRRPGARRVGRPGALGAQPPGGRLRGDGAAAGDRRASRPASATASRAGGAGRRRPGCSAPGLAQLPAALVIVGRRGAGLRRAAATVRARSSWTAVGLAVLLNIFGQALQLSHWVLDISPFTHVPRLPGGTVTAAPLLWLAALAVVLGGPASRPCGAATSASAVPARRCGLNVTFDRLPAAVGASSPHRRAGSATLGLRTGAGSACELSVLLMCYPRYLLRRDTPKCPLR